MKLSSKGAAWLKQVEQLHLNPYDDQTGKPIQRYVPGATIGYGHLIRSKEEFSKYAGGVTKAIAEKLFLEDLAPFEQLVATAFRSLTTPLKENQVDALIILAYNIGGTNFATSSVVRMIRGIKTGYPTLETAWKAWNKSQGKVMNGLINRRAAEWDMYAKALYRFW